MPGDSYIVNYDINVLSQNGVVAIDQFVAATKRLQEAKNQFNSLNSTINSVNQRFAAWSKKAPVIQINTKQATDKINKLIGRVEVLEQRLRGVGIVGAGGNGTLASKKADTLISGGATGKGTTKTTGTQKSQRGVSAGRKTAATATRPVTRMGRGNVRYQALGQTLIDTGGVGAFDFIKGMGIAYGIAGIGSLVGNVIRDATEYNNLMQTTRNILYAHDPNKLTFDSRFRGMERIIRNVGVETKFTAPEVADASKFLAMAGFDIDAINRSIRPIADIALVGDNDLGETADVVTNIMTGFGIEPSQVRRAADIMTMTFTKSNTTLMEIAESYKYAGSLLARNGTSFEEATAAIGVLGDAGIKGSQAGTTLRTMALNIAKPTKGQAEAWERLGISRTDENGNVRSLLDLFKELGARNLSLSQFGQLFHKTAASGASALAAHVDKWNEVVEKNFMSDGMSARLAEAKKNTIQGLWYQLTSSFTEAGMQAFEDMEGPIRNVLTRVIGWLKSQETIDLIKRFSLTIADLAGTLLNITKVLIDLYKRFEPIIKLWLKAQVVLSLVLVPLRALNAMLNFGRYAINGARQIGALTLRFNGLANSILNVGRARAVAERGGVVGGVAGGIAGGGMMIGGHSMAAWRRYAGIYGGGAVMGRMLKSPYVTGFGSMLGGIAGGYLGTKLGEEGSGWSMFGGLLGSVGGMALGAKLPAILGALGVAGGAAVGVLGVLVGLIVKMNIETNKAIQAGNDWANSFKSLGIEKLNLNTADGVLIGNLRIYNSQLQTQNEKLAMSIDLYERYWKAKNGEETTQVDTSKPFVETAAGEFFKEWLDSGRRIGGFKPVVEALGQAGIGGKYTELWSLPSQDMHGRVTPSHRISASWNGIDFNYGDAAKLDQVDAASVTLARLAADQNNPNAVGLENYLSSVLIGAASPRIARQYLDSAASKFIPEGNPDLAYPKFKDLSGMSWDTIQTIPGYANYWIPIGQKMIEAWEPLVLAMEELEKAVPDENVVASYRDQWIPAMFGQPGAQFLTGFGTEGWKERLNDMYLNPSKYGYDNETKLRETANSVLDALYSTYRSMNAKFAPLLAGYFADEAWKGLNFEGLNIPGLGVLNQEGQLEAIRNAVGGGTTPPPTPTPTGGGGNGGYTNQYKSTTAAPKQIIVKIENLMNVESVDMTDPAVATTIGNLKDQMAQALIEVVADFDANANNLV